MPDYYSDNPGEGGGGDMPGGQAPTPKAEGGDNVTALLPRAILAGKEFNVGDEVVLEITAIHDDEIEVKYATEKKGKKGEEEGEGEMPKGDNEMASLMQDTGGGGY